MVDYGSAGTITIVGVSAQTINQSSSFTLSGQNQAATFVSNGATGWVTASSTTGTFVNPVTFFSTALFNGAATFSKAAIFNSSTAYLEQTLVITSNIAAWDMSLGPDAYVTSALAFTFAAPTNYANGMRGKLRINNSAATLITLTWNGVFGALANSGGLPANVAPGVTYFEWWISGGVIYVSRVPMNGTLNYSLTNTTTSGTTSDFIIPAWAKRIAILLAGVSTNGTSSVLVQLGAGSVTTTGYLGASALIIGGTTSVTNLSSGFLVIGSGSDTAAAIRHGAINFTLSSSNTWIGTGPIGWSNTNTECTIAGSIALSGTIDRLRLTTVGGTDTFDAGSATVICEG